MKCFGKAKTTEPSPDAVRGEMSAIEKQKIIAQGKDIANRFEKSMQKLWEEATR